MVTDAVRKSRDRDVLAVAALSLARAGNIKHSKELVEKLNQLFPNHLTLQAFSLPTIRAAIKLKENDPTAAIEILQPVAPYEDFLAL